MRSIEALVSVANVLAFLSLAIPLPITLHWLRYSVPIALLLAFVQGIGEGPRWQMIPAYGLTVAFFVIWLLGAVTTNRQHVNGIIAVLGIGLGAVGLFVSIILPIVLPIFHFPKPSGPYAIGTVIYHWVDTSRPELFTIDPNDHRELMAQVWYPAKQGTALPPSPYIDDADHITPVLARLFRFPTFALTHLRYVMTNAMPSAPLADDLPSYPVLIYLSGQNGFRQASTFQIEALTSHGYIVVALDPPGASALVHFPDGREVYGQPRDVMYPLVQQSVEPLDPTPTLFGTAMPDGLVPYFAADVSFALDQIALLNKTDPNNRLTGRLDLAHIGIFGVSLGGINSAEACSKDSRLKACLIMDVFMSANVVRDGLQQPTMWITRDADTMRLERERSGGWTEKDIEQHQSTMRTVYEGLKGDGYYLQIPQMFHLNLTDIHYWSPLLSQLGMLGSIDGQRIFDIVNAYSVAFFDKHLKGQPSPLLDSPSSQYPEVQFESRR